MHSILSGILVEKHGEVARLNTSGIPSCEEMEIPSIRDFKGAISIPKRVNLIAEIKFASPSAGAIIEDGDPISIGQSYEKAGAAAISLITDRKYFRGDINHLPQLKKATSLPILRKDFIIHEIQVRQSYLWGADAILLIARILPKAQLKNLLDTCKELGMAALTEVHDRDDLKKAVECGAHIIGINNRNLDTFEVDLGTTFELASLIPNGHVIVSESGIMNKSDIWFLKQWNVHAVLVGTSIMKSRNMLDKTREFVLAGSMEDGQG
ncbi:MAG: indole-3-glycerol phosphate synthase TrpC [Pseudomonadota bacterium]